MKTNFLILSLLSLFLISGCQKKELASPDQGRVINLNLSGVSTEILEFIYKDSVVASTNASKFSITTLLAVDGEAATLDIRKQGTSEILQSRKITEAPFNQSISIYYDGSKIYENAVTLLLKGYAMSGEVEFLIDGQLAGEGSVKIDKTLTLYMDNEQTRTLTIRKKGETTALLTKTINANPASGQSVTFFFDGTSIVDNIKLSPPSNPANMSITGQFSSLFQLQSAGALFKGGDVDLVFYIRDNAGVVTVPNPAIRITMPSSGAFVNFELPPLPNANSFYTYDICEVGTETLPYKDYLIPTTYPPKINQGRFFGELKFGTSHFEAGTSKLLLLQDGMSLKVSPAAIKGRYFFGKITDLSEYFQ